jgi:hypothetical protein
MQEALNLAQAGSRRPFASPETSPIALSKVVYRSRAVKSLSPPELHDLTSSSQVRNNRDGITGLMLYDNERFYQWLEGPAENVGRLMGSICNDARHTDVEILDKAEAESRTFAGWGMKLATPLPVAPSWRQDVIEPPPEIMDGLRAQPEAAPVLLVKLLDLAPGAAAEAEDGGLGRTPLNQKTADILKRVFLTTVLPHLTRAERLQPGRPLPADPRAVELAELLVATDRSAAFDLIQEIQVLGGAFAPLAATLFEPAARILGDLWGEDLCTEFDVTLGLCRLQAAARLLAVDTLHITPDRLSSPMVLIAPEPGELHRLGAVLDRIMLRNAGWSPQCAYPEDGHGLNDTLSSGWFDVLNLSLSTAFRREHLLPQVSRTISEARLASRNPALVVIVGGRVFLEEKTAAAEVGANEAATTSLNVNRTIQKAISATRTSTGTLATAVQAVATPS